MKNHLYIDEENVASRLRWLMASRVAIVTFLLGIATFIDVKGMEPFSYISLPHLFIIIFFTYLISIIYIILLRIIRNIRFNIYIQTFCDVLLITGLVYVTGGINSIYSVFYPLVIIYAVLFLPRSGVLIIASASAIFYGLLLDFEYYGVISPPPKAMLQDYYYSAGYVFSRIIIHTVSFYIIAILASFVVEKEKRTRTLLEETETAFRQLDLLHRSMIESVDAGILTTNLLGNIKSFNRAAEEITGYFFAEIEDHNVDKMFPGLGEMLSQIDSMDYASATKKRVELSFTGKGHEEQILGCSISPLKNNRGRRIGSIIIFQDLTAIKKMERTIERNRRLAFIGEMAAVLAHEMRNPLASISGSIQVLKKDLMLSETDEKLMQIVLRGKDQLESFMRDFLLLARPSSGDSEEFDLKDVITDVVESLHYVPDWHEGIEIVRRLNGPSFVHANRVEIRQIIWNLVLNAVQSMPEGGRLTIETGWSPEGDDGLAIEMRISDTGCGIESKYLGKIMEPFYTTKERGTGLGLAIVNRVVEGQGGTLRIDSVPNGGTTCTVWLPQNAERTND
jgi:two-component system, NtrC family, sensor histidine kinase PilS